MANSTLVRNWRSCGATRATKRARGVVTPRDDNKIILFVTHEKPTHFEQYEDQLTGDTPHWEGPTDHFAEDRMLAAGQSGDEMHLFYRDRHGGDFRYQGQLQLVSCERFQTAQAGLFSRWVYRLGRHRLIPKQLLRQRHLRGAGRQSKLPAAIQSG